MAFSILFHIVPTHTYSLRIQEMFRRAYRQIKYGLCVPRLFDKISSGRFLNHLINKCMYHHVKSNQRSLVLLISRRGQE